MGTPGTDLDQLSTYNALTSTSGRGGVEMKTAGHDWWWAMTVTQESFLEEGLVMNRVVQFYCKEAGNWPEDFTRQLTRAIAGWSNAHLARCYAVGLTGEKIKVYVDAHRESPPML